MYPHLVGTDDHAGYLLARPVGRDFHEAPGRQRVNPVCGEGRLRGGPRQLQVVGQESSAYLSARYCLPDPLFLLEFTPALLLLLLALLLREEHVVDSDVHLRDVEAHEVLHAVDDVLANGLGDLRDRLSVLDRQRYVDRGLNLADLHGDPARLAAAATDVAAGHAAQDPAYSLLGTAAHPDAVYFLRCDAGDLGNDAVFDPGAPSLCLEWAVLLLGPLFAHSPLLSLLQRDLFCSSANAVRILISSRSPAA